MPRLISFSDALKETDGQDRNLLIGNGFSSKFFNYRDLLEKSGIADNSPLRKLFAALGTVDFELAMRSLEDAAVVETAYDMKRHAEELVADANILREGLVHAIKETHPKFLTEATFSYERCANFLQYFGSVFTLNYDLLLYWASLHTKHLRDGFGLGKDKGGFHGPFKEEAYCEIFNLHGGLHLFDDGTGETIKALNTGDGVIDQISRTILNRKRLPVYVAEATSNAKMKKINSVPYLRHCYQMLQKKTANTFIYGHSAADNDSHIYRAIFSSKVERLYFGVYRQNDDKLKAFDAQLAKFQRLAGSKLDYSFFDAESANVWDT